VSVGGAAETAKTLINLTFGQMSKRYRTGASITTVCQSLQEIIRFEDRTDACSREPNAQTRVTNSMPETTVPQSVDSRLVDRFVFANALQSTVAIAVALFVATVALCRLVHKL